MTHAFDADRWALAEHNADRRLRGLAPVDRLPLRLVEAESPPDDGVPPPASPEDYGLPSEGEMDSAPFDATAVLRLVTPRDWPEGLPPAVRWAVHERIPCGDVSTLAGDGGSGKTMAALMAAAAIARGAPDWLGRPLEQGAAAAVFLSAEEPEDEIRRRLYRIGKRHSFDPADLDKLHLWFPDELGDCALARSTPGGVMEPTPLFRQISEAVARIRPVLVVLDNIAAVFPGSQNDRVSVRTFVNLWRGLARSSGAAVLLLDHPSLSGLTAGTGRGGSMDWRNSVRSALHLKAAEEREDAARGVRLLECVKNNYAPLGEAVRLEWVDGVLSVEGTASPMRVAARDLEIDAKFLELLAECARQGRPVGHKPSSTFAPKVFAGMADNGGHSDKAFRRAMERLFRAGKIVVAEEGPPAKRRERIVLASLEKAP